jgi:hypothetical protein
MRNQRDKVKEVLHLALAQCTADVVDPAPHLLVFACTAGRHRSAYLAGVAVRLLRSRGRAAAAFWPSLCCDRSGMRAAKAGEQFLCSLAIQTQA